MATLHLSSAFKALKGHGNMHNQKNPGQLSSVRLRPAQPADSTRPSLAALSNDLLAYILELVQDTSPKSLPNCMLVCSSLYHHARHAQYRELSINVDSNDSVKRLESASKDNLLSAVRTLHVYGKGDLPSHLDTMIKEMTGLRKVEWAAATITKSIVQILQSSPHTALEVLITGSTRDLLSQLSESTSVVSVSVDVRYYEAEECTKITHPLKQVLLSCPNLRKLSLNLAIPQGGCVWHEPPPEYVGIGFSAGERPPPLQHLCIPEYPWGYKERDTDIFNFNCVGYPEEGYETDYWAETFDWSRLTHLDNASFHFANKLMRKLIALKHVRFSFIPGSKGSLFFNAVPSALESICVPTLNTIGLGSLEQHAASLHKLYLHQEPLGTDRWREAIISMEDLILVCQTCPQLREIGLDLARDGNDWPYTKLDILATLSNIQRLEFWFELGNTPESPPRPDLTMTSASELFGYLAKRSSTLRSLYLHSGSPERPGGLVAEKSYWKSENAISLVCQHAERDDDAARGVSYITCPKLSDELNHKANRIIRGQRKLKARQSMALTLDWHSRDQSR